MAMEELSRPPLTGGGGWLGGGWAPPCPARAGSPPGRLLRRGSHQRVVL